MKSFLMFFFVLFICCLFTAPNTSAQDSTGAGSDDMQVWIDYLTPGNVHTMIAKSAGEWKTKTTFWTAPGAEPMVSEGKIVNEMILGGRYLMTKMNGTAWGMPMEGLMLLGYDNVTMEFTSVWIDNLGTGTIVGKGKWDGATNSITFMGTMVDPPTKSEVPYKEVYTLKDENTQMSEFYSNLPDGTEFKMMQIDFTR